MPLVTEDAPKRRRPPWAWLVLAPVPLLVLVPTVLPLHLQWGDTVVVIKGDFQGGNNGWCSYDINGGPVETTGGRTYVATGSGMLHSRWLQLGRLSCGASWFKGHPANR